MDLRINGLGTLDSLIRHTIVVLEHRCIAATWHYCMLTKYQKLDTMDLIDTARQLTAKGKGLLASDESTGTIGKRLTKAGLTNDEVSQH